MDTKAQGRLKVLMGMLAGRISVSEAAEVMGLSPRHTRRLVKRFEAQGATALVHGNRGRPPSNRLPDERRLEILELVEAEYSGFNDVHLQEALQRDHETSIGRETLRGLLRASGRQATQRRRAPKHRRRRERWPCRGMLVQWDGSHHHWVGKDFPQWVLMAAVDDADGRLIAARFMPSESAVGYLLLLEAIVESEGIPQAIYQDRHGALCRNDGHWSLEEQLAGSQFPTQIGAILEDLGVETIFARSAQGKGRIERFFGVAQDRLCSELRRCGITEIEEANQFLDEYWFAEYNTRFALQPKDPESVYCPLDAASRRRLLAFRYERTVASDNTVCLGDLEISIPPGPRRRSYAKARVEVRQHTDGSWTVYYEGRSIATHGPTPFHKPKRVRIRRSGRRRVRGAKETLQVYFTPSNQELAEEAARLD